MGQCRGVRVCGWRGSKGGWVGGGGRRSKGGGERAEEGGRGVQRGEGGGSATICSATTRSSGRGGVAGKGGASGERCFSAGGALVLGSRVVGCSERECVCAGGVEGGGEGTDVSCR